MEKEAFNNNIEKHFSLFYESANNLSINSQKLYLLFFKLTIVPLILNSSISVIMGFIKSDFILSNSSYVYYFMVLVLFISIISSYIVHLSKLQNTWYSARAIAESIKTMSWKYICCTHSYCDSPDSNMASKNFIKDLRRIINDNSTIFRKMSFNSVNDDYNIITHEMTVARNTHWEIKKENYINQRILNQKEWYFKKAQYNNVMKIRWFLFSIVLQFISFLIMIFISYSSNTFNVISLLSTGSIAALSWIQVKQFQDLSQAYHTTFIELQMIYEQGINKVSTVDEFKNFVEDAEKAISREHTLWIARRDHLSLNKLIK